MSYPYPHGGNPYTQQSDNQSGYPTQGSYPMGAVYGSSGPGFPPLNTTQGYPPSSSPGYPPTSNPSYPPTSNPGYPPTSNPGYPPTATPGYPATTGQGFPVPGSAPGYPLGPPSQGYPTSAYPPATQPNQGYPQSYPSAGDAYPQQGYPSAGQGYPPSQPSGYPPSQPGGYPASQGFGYPSSQAQGYPTQPQPQASIYPSAGNVMHSAPAGAPIYQSTGIRTSSSKRWEPSTVSSSAARTMASIKPYPAFNANDDAQALRKAMKGFGTDEAAIIAVLCARNSEQRQVIMTTYKQMHGRDLVKDLKSELSGKFEDIIVGLMTPMHQYLASELRAAIAGLGTNEDTLVEILCTRSNAEINQIKFHYKQLYGKDLEKDISSDTSGNFKRVMVSMCNASREEGVPVDVARAAADAQRLYNAGVAQWGTDESTFRMILCSQSYDQLRQVFREYARLADHDIMEAIKKETSGELKKAFLTIVKAVYNTQLYFAERLHEAMKGAGTDDRTLIRIVVSRSELDLALIRQEYQRSYGKSLEEAIKNDTSGDYRKALIALVSGN